MKERSVSEITPPQGEAGGRKRPNEDETRVRHEGEEWKSAGRGGGLTAPQKRHSFILIILHQRATNQVFSSCKLGLVGVNLEDRLWTAEHDQRKKSYWPPCSAPIGADRVWLIVNLREF
ncbi:hypothetical protein TNCV_3374051 [Trichonephila clavipes]|nr:hypothetical protein TNCV_3374051 [Trichonephila clavipes]